LCDFGFAALRSSAALSVPSQQTAVKDPPLASFTVRGLRPKCP